MKKNQRVQIVFQFIARHQSTECRRFPATNFIICSSTTYEKDTFTNHEAYCSQLFVFATLYTLFYIWTCLRNGQMNKHLLLVGFTTIHTFRMVVSVLVQRMLTMRRCYSTKLCYTHSTHSLVLLMSKHTRKYL